ncbi:MAG: ABC transporter substrate-binding protein [Myxococcota bacterium]
MKTLTRLLTVLALVAFSTPALAANPDEMTAKLLDYWKAGTNVESPTPLPADLAMIFDYGQLTKSAIEPHKGQFNAKQLGRYTQVFSDLLKRTVHTRAGAAIGKTDYKVSKSKKVEAAREVKVSAYIPEEDITTDVVFVWENHAVGWQVIDVRIDGASLVNDYRNQFGRLINKDGVDGFLTKLERKLEKTAGNG